MDVAILINDLQALNFAGMAAAGYDFRGEQERGRYLFVKRQNGNISTHHVHCYTQKADDRTAYTSGKAEFIKAAIVSAKERYQAI